MNELRSDLRTAAWLALAVAALTALTALIVHLTWADGARNWLRFSFSGLPERPSEAASVFINNVRLLSAALLGSLIAAAARRSTARASGLAMQAIVRCCDVVIALACAANVVFVGLALGAYGRRALAATVPHGPLELLAFTLALAVYIAAHREPVGYRRLVVTAVAGVAALAVAAVLEVFLNLGGAANERHPLALAEALT
jgi:hypothetical protein